MVKSYPKKKRIKLSNAEYHRLRYMAWYNAEGCCEATDKEGNRCGRYAPFDSTTMTNGELHHIKSRGAGGDDLENNSMWVCLYCHEKIHKGLISQSK